MNLPKPAAPHVYVYGALCCVALLMFVSAILLAWSASETYQPVKAEVRGTRIESTRPGTPQWSLIVDFDYEAGGILYQKRRVDVFHDSDRRVTENQEKEWPPGKEFTVYIRQGNPESFSLSPSREADGVLAALLMGMAAAIMTPLFIAWRRGIRRPEEETLSES